MKTPAANAHSSDAGDGSNGPDGPRFSVALCTYNGARYLPEQLATIRDQRHAAAEVVACDDGSSDATLEQLRAFSSTRPRGVRVERNAINLGSTQNFAKAIAMAGGGLIALADQDDAWLPQKLATLRRGFRDPGVGYAFSDAVMVDQNGDPLGYRLWDAIRFRPAERRRFRETGGLASLVRNYRVTGATMAFRAAFKPLVLPIPDCWVHDGWIAILISAVSKGLPIAEPLVRYRQHARQQIGEKKRGLLEQRRVAQRQGREYFERQVEAFSAVLDRLVSQTGFEPHPFALPLLREKVDFCKRRLAMRTGKSWRAPGVAAAWLAGGYSRLDRGWKAAAQDLFL